MIRIYINDKCVVLDDKCTTNSTNSKLVCTLEEIKKEYDLFLTSADSNLILSGKDLVGHFFSLFTVIEAAGGIVKADDRFLFIYRLGKWDLPKGKIDDGETAESAAVREVEEECSVTGIRLGDLVHTSYHVYEFKKQSVLKPTYWYSMESDACDLVPQLEEDIEHAEWLSIEELPKVLNNTYPSIIDVIKKSGIIPEE